MSIEGTTLYCGDNCNHTGPHRYRPVEKADPKPLWGEHGPAKGFAFTHESGIGMRWTGTHWEEAK